MKNVYVVLVTFLLISSSCEKQNATRTDLKMEVISDSTHLNKEIIYTIPNTDKIIKREYYFTPNDYSISYYHEQKLIYLEEYRDNKLVNKLSFGVLDKDRTIHFLISNYCSSCHFKTLDVDEFKSFKTILETKPESLSFDSLKQRIGNSQDNHHKYYHMHDEDIRRIKRYIENLFTPKY